MRLKKKGKQRKNPKNKMYTTDINAFNTAYYVLNFYFVKDDKFVGNSTLGRRSHFSLCTYNLDLYINALLVFKFGENIYTKLIYGKPMGGIMPYYAIDMKNRAILEYSAYGARVLCTENMDVGQNEYWNVIKFSNYDFFAKLKKYYSIYNKYHQSK